MKFSEKRTYSHNGELIFITKEKRDQSNKFSLITFTNLATQEVSTVKDDQLIGAIQTLNSTDFFKMYVHIKNFLVNDPEHSKDIANKAIESLRESKIEMHGSNKFEPYDLRNLSEVYRIAHENKFVGVQSDIESIIHLFDGGYTYNVVFDDKQRRQYDILVEIGNEIQKEITKEIDHRSVIEFMEAARKS